MTPPPRTLRWPTSSTLHQRLTKMKNEIYRKFPSTGNEDDRLCRPSSTAFEGGQRPLAECCGNEALCPYGQARVDDTDG